MDDDDEYILQDRDGDYVKTVTGGGSETIKLTFDFTKKRSEARVFTYMDLWNPKATTSVIGEFTKGYSGGRAIPIAPF